MTKRAVIFTWDGFQDQEVIYPYHRLKGEGFETIIVGPRDGKVEGLFGTKFDCNYFGTFLADPRQFHRFVDLLILPGGVKALEKIRQEKQVINVIRDFEGTIGSICHGAQLLISAGRCNGEVIAGYYSIEDDITNAAGVYSREPVVSNNIVSAAHYDDMGKWMNMVLSVFEEHYGNR